ncbi:hypothetical protein DES45_107153 [Microvirga subterranea]|uniref:Uncharacterized protein n=1 Tax=Microvirga subterranea TaxID=186651 RepID=A0A370HM24_9HYPH|nr:hypothetical protein DES45_107153 [Microvirga subterranea]
MHYRETDGFCLIAHPAVPLQDRATIDPNEDASSDPVETELYQRVEGVECRVRACTTCPQFTASQGWLGSAVRRTQSTGE